MLRRSSARAAHIRPDPALGDYLRAYKTGVEAFASVEVATLEPFHHGFSSSLHRGAGVSTPDISAFLYAAQRLPECIDRVERIVFGQRDEIFAAAGLLGVEGWSRVRSCARPRRCHYDGDRILAIFVTSLTDLDDLVPSVCAFQIEWNKLHRLLGGTALKQALADGKVSASAIGDTVRDALGLSRQDWEMLWNLWGHDWDRKLAAVARAPLALRIDRLPMNEPQFEEAAAKWWDELSVHLDLPRGCDRPIYLVSSNNHSLANLVSGFSTEREQRLIDFIEREDPNGLRDVWRHAVRDADWSRTELLYYALRFYLEAYPDEVLARTASEEAAGLVRYLPNQFPRLEVQRLELNQLDRHRLDARLTLPAELAHSRALILNLDYPLGLAAGHLLTQACKRFPKLRGLLVLGKSAAAIGRIGDIMVPGEVHDVRTGNHYRFQNCMTLRQLTPFLTRIAAYDEQKSITVQSVFLHGRHVVGELLRRDFTGIEMEAGPYLDALYRHFIDAEPHTETLLHLKLPPNFHFGLLHYTSDTPYNIRPSLLSTGLGTTGLEGAYASALAFLQYAINLAAVGANGSHMPANRIGGGRQ